MAYNTNFDVIARIDAGKLIVTGHSSGDYGGLKLVSRHLIVQQGETLRARQAEETSQGNWKALRPMPADGFEPGPALAQGAETYYLERQGAAATFVTVTWSQAIKIQ